MDTRGSLYELTEEQLREFGRAHNAPLIPLDEEEYQQLKPMSKGRRKNKMRNKPCLCGSGKKFKKCCWNNYA